MAELFEMEITGAFSVVLFCVLISVATVVSFITTLSCCSIAINKPFSLLSLAAVRLLLTDIGVNGRITASGAFGATLTEGSVVAF